MHKIQGSITLAIHFAKIKKTLRTYIENIDVSSFLKNTFVHLRLVYIPGGDDNEDNIVS